MGTPSASPSPFALADQSGQVADKLPPATPVYILRGHASSIHALRFYSRNSRLISGDADGWIVVWDMSTKRAVASWKAHGSAVLGLQGVVVNSEQDEAGQGQEGGNERWVFTHGRDHKFRVWRLNLADEESLSKELPVDESKSVHPRNEPWMLHSLPVNALNFCAFALCRIFPDKRLASDTKSLGCRQSASVDCVPIEENSKPQHIFFLAVPNALNTGGIDVFHLPSEKRVSTISPDPSINTGMVMAVELFRCPQGNLCLISGYEDGRVMVHTKKSLESLESLTINQSSFTWERIYINHPHSQPILSLSLSPPGRNEHDMFFLSSSADEIIAKHPITASKSPLKVLNTKHAGQQGLRIRNDGKIFATAGWDCRIRVYSCKSMKELAVLKWHKEGCYAVDFADLANENKMNDNDNANTGRKSPGYSDEPNKVDAMGPAADAPNSDTDTKPRTMALNRVTPVGSLAAIKEQRSQKAQSTHWLGAGSKDGKISLWDIY
ncbi:uncharacterized protein PADG_05463 [Paracoccidioides brasiliensis Pb18]|uniref:ASTRA-associated protein 1 n=2 Tax=Paracoccidioides brasiliensis TaxID=121759 RepID=C1GDX7_PARBD|nr:uncharacterized protein PADG_05463 [Paracoccidioides brasiliensis Pb18]EEH49384.1 hypothetical protein PADG_05463 [Paracoccidioides brasiliensis Pb18]ODH41910.1 hypothetical protein ACO22_01274 [Paracoccidioides brasiliensis]